MCSGSYLEVMSCVQISGRIKVDYSYLFSRQYIL